jgi:tetratricopeptide (TPR) repeat protein
MTGQFIGTAAWASPEQAAGRVDQVDTRTDIHALGLMLYHALAGGLPYDVTGSARQVLDAIITSAPRRLRSSNPAIDEDLETIVLKCLEKEPDRRYPSVAHLITDLQHYLRAEPIEARRSSAMYMLRKTLRRYRAAGAVALAFVVVISGFAIAMTLLYGRAEREARKAERVAGFLESVFAAVDPVVAQGRDNTFLREALDEAVARIDELDDVPAAEARVRHTVGQTYLRLGLYAAAADHLREALDLRSALLGPDATETAATAALLGEALLELEQYAAAERLLADARRVHEGLDGADRLTLAETLDGLAHLHFVQRDYVAAEPLLREALALRRRHGAAPVAVAQSLANLGSLLRNQGRFEQAEPLLREALAICQQQLGPQHVHTIIAMNKLMLLLKMRGQYEAAIALGQEALALRIAVDGEQHPHVGVSHFNLARAYAAAGDDAAAAEHFRAALEIWRAVYPDRPFGRDARGGGPGRLRIAARGLRDRGAVVAGSLSRVAGRGGNGRGAVRADHHAVGEPVRRMATTC